MISNSTFEVEKIIQLRIRDGNIKEKEYLTKWKGYSASQNTWEPAENFKTSGEEVVWDYLDKLARYKRKGTKFGPYKYQAAQFTYYCSFSQKQNFNYQQKEESKQDNYIDFIKKRRKLEFKKEQHSNENSLSQCHSEDDDNQSYEKTTQNDYRTNIYSRKEEQEMCKVFNDIQRKRRKMKRGKDTYSKDYSSYEQSEDESFSLQDYKINQKNKQSTEQSYHNDSRESNIFDGLSSLDKNKNLEVSITESEVDSSIEQPMEGSYKHGDRPLRVLNDRRENGQLFFKVSWKFRLNGFQPRISEVTNEDIKQKDPTILNEYYESKLISKK